MPPSGYNSTEARAITSFLDSISQSLIEEGTKKQLSPKDAIQAECNNIQAILSGQCSPYQSAVLSLTRDFYKIALTKEPNSYDDLRSVMVKELESVGDEILAIHVPEI